MSDRQTAAGIARAHLSATLVEVGRGDNAAFRELYALTNMKLLRECLRVCADRQIAEDVLHEVYLLIWQKAGMWQPERASPITWLATIARNRSIDRLRSEGVSKWEASLDVYTRAPLSDCLEQSAIAACRLDRMRRHLDGLKPEQKEALRYAFLQDMTYADIAAIKGVPLSTVKSWIRRGLARLKLRLQEDDRELQDARCR